MIILEAAVCGADELTGVYFVQRMYITANHSFELTTLIKTEQDNLPDLMFTTKHGFKDHPQE